MASWRTEKLNNIRQTAEFDAIVVGGGINGISAYRELALQGLRVLLVERNDFCSGCSAAPSRMIHGGLRYLENGEFQLVRESLEERDALLLNAPHLVRPLETTIPIATLFSGLLNGAKGFFTRKGSPSRRGALAIKIGLSFYDFFTRKRRLLPKHVMRGRRKTKNRWPALTPKLKYSATYYDAWISHPERLAIEMIRDCETEAPNAIALNYASLRRVDGAFQVTDHLDGGTVAVTTKTLVNATGAWLDATNKELVSPETLPGKPFVGGTKGSHLIIDNKRLLAALDGSMILFENTDGRVCILFPYLGNALLGSTDLRVDAPGPMRCEDEELAYILKSLSVVFPGIRIEPDEIVYTYAGVRPLPQSDAEFTGRISRDHFIRKIDGSPPTYCMIGGKWSTFRAFGDQTADAVLADLGRPRTVDTCRLPIGGGADFPADEARDLSNRLNELTKNFGVSRERARHVLDHYGSTARDVLTHCAESEDAPLAPGCPITQREVRWLIANEYALFPADIILRRTSLAITGKLSAAMISAVCREMAAALDWSEEETLGYEADFMDALNIHHRVSAAMLQQRDEDQHRAGIVYARSQPSEAAM